MKITKTQQKKIIEFLEYYKQFVGLSDWTVMLAIDAKGLGDDTLAIVEPNIYEQTLKFGLSEEFFKKDEKKQVNILFHELVHGRVCVFSKKLEELQEIIEEHMVNDLVRGFEKFGVLKYDKKTS